MTTSGAPGAKPGGEDSRVGPWPESGIASRRSAVSGRCRRNRALEYRADDAGDPALGRTLVGGAGGDAGEQRIAVLVPFAAGVIVAEHGGRAARLVDDAEREIGFGQPVQRLGNMRRRLEIVDDAAEAVDCREILALTF